MKVEPRLFLVERSYRVTDAAKSSMCSITLRKELEIMEMFTEKRYIKRRNNERDWIMVSRTEVKIEE